LPIDLKIPAGGGGGGGGEYYYANRNTLMEFFEDFLGYDTTQTPKLYGGSGGLWQDAIGGNRVNPTNYAGGVVLLGAAGGGYDFCHAIRTMGNANNGDIAELLFRHVVTTYQTAGQWVGCGFYISPNDFILIAQSSAGNFRYLMMLGGALTNRDSGVPIDNAWHQLSIKAEFHQVTFQIDGAAEHIEPFGVGVFRQGEWKPSCYSSNALARASLDYVWGRQTFANPRNP